MINPQAEPSALPNETVDLPEDILIVDDEADARLIVKLVLKRFLNYQSREASDGLEALELVRQKPPRLIILDLTMPRMDGIAFLEQMRADPAIADIPVLIFTAHLVTADQAERLQIPSSMIMRKSGIKIDELGNTIRQILQ
ncbi:MAG: response regulator [Anaerolineae bacterium]|nr:response regulator [Anaerolineae bacterium]